MQQTFHDFEDFWARKRKVWITVAFLPHAVFTFAKSFCDIISSKAWVIIIIF